MYLARNGCKWGCWKSLGDVVEQKTVAKEKKERKKDALYILRSVYNSPVLQQSSDKLQRKSLFETRTRRSGVLCRRRAFCLARGFRLQSVLTNTLRTRGICLNIDCAVTLGFKVQLERGWEGGIGHSSLHPSVLPYQRAAGPLAAFLFHLTPANAI